MEPADPEVNRRPGSRMSDPVHDAQAYTPIGGARPAAPAYARDLVGYGRNPPDPRWPGQARVAVQFVINYEEVSIDPPRA